MSKRDDDDKPGYFCREELPPHLKDHAFYGDYPTRREMDAFISAAVDEVCPDGLRALPREDREAATIAEKAASFQDAAAKFAADLLASVVHADRVRFAAPPPVKMRKRTAFDPRTPVFIPERHGPFRGTTRNFSDIAQRLGKTAAHGTNIRSELTLISLANGQAPPWQAICDARQHKPKTDEGPIAAAIFPILWGAHGRAMAEAEASGVAFDIDAANALQSPKAALLAELFQSMALVKTGANIRSMFHALANVIDACRREIEG